MTHKINKTPDKTDSLKNYGRADFTGLHCSESRERLRWVRNRERANKILRFLSINLLTMHISISIK